MIRTKQTGITLIEVVVTMFVMTVGLLGLAGLQTTSIKDGLDNAKRSQVLWLVTEIVERARANPDGQATGYNLTIESSDCGSVPAPRCSDNGAGDASIACSATEMAAFDVWEVFCGQAEAGVMANSVDALQLKSVTSGCAGACTDNSDFSVTINWDSTAVDNSKQLSGESDSVYQARIDSQKNQSVTMTVRP